LVGTVDNNGPAQAGGIEPGDLIVRFDGKDIRRPGDLTRIVADTPIGKEVEVTLIRRGQEGATTLKLGQRLVLSGTALDAYRQKLSGMQQELESLGALKGNWGPAELQRFSELFEQFEDLKKAIPPEDSIVQNLWGQLEREFRIYKGTCRQHSASEGGPEAGPSKSTNRVRTADCRTIRSTICDLYDAAGLRRAVSAV